jgi:LacI family transcriptional regulator, galactose operon repressor
VAGTTQGPRRETTIKDVAATAGVSVATVSRVLNGSDRVDAELAARVHDAVARLGYRRSGLARSLRSRRARVVGLVISDIRNPFFTDVVRGVEDRVGADGYSLVLCNSDEELAKEADYLDLIVEERMAGAIVSPASSDETRLDALTARGTPVVVIDREAAREAVDTVLVDNVRGGSIAVHHLAENGYRRIACVTGPPRTSTGSDRLAGWEAGLREAGLPIEDSLLRHADFKESGGHAGATDLLAGPDRPDAFFVANNLMTVGVLAALREAGLEVPGDVGVVGFDDMPWARLLRPALTTVAQPTYELGRRAAGLLEERIQGVDSPPRRVVLEPRLEIRESALGRDR